MLLRTMSPEIIRKIKAILLIGILAGADVSHIQRNLRLNEGLSSKSSDSSSGTSGANLQEQAKRVAEQMQTMTNPEAQEETNRVAQHINGMIVGPNIHAQAQRAAEHAMSADPHNSRQAEGAAAQIEAIISDPSLKDLVLRLAEHTQTTEINTNLREPARRVAEQVRMMMANTQSQQQARLAAEQHWSSKVSRVHHPDLDITTLGKPGDTADGNSFWSIEEGRGKDEHAQRLKAKSEEGEEPLPLDHEIDDPNNPAHRHPGAERWRYGEFLRIIGPGLMTCLADTDGPCLQTAASSGVQYKYGLVLVQIFLMPVLFAAQELTVRLGLATKDGITGLIKRRFGNFWAWFACTLHVLMCIQQQMGEFGCVAQIATEVWGTQRWWPPLLYFAMLFANIILGRAYFRALEIFGMVAGSCQLLLIGVMFATRPSAGEFFKGIFKMPFRDMNYNILMAGNIGAVIMPWMLYYQQSAIVQRKLKASKIDYLRVDTGIGSVLAQMVMLSTVVAMGTVAYGGPNSPGTGFADIVTALSGTLGSELASKWIISVAMVGACTCASLCLMVTPVWSIQEIMRHTEFDQLVQRNQWLFSLQVTVGLVLAYLMAVCTTVSSTPTWAIMAQVVNASLILPVACFLWLLASDAKILPYKYRLKGFYKWLLFTLFSIVCSYCGFGTIMTIKNPPG